MLAIFGREIIFTSRSENGQRLTLKSAILHQMNATQIRPNIYYYKTMKSPVGSLKMVASERGLAAILWENDKPNRVRLGPLKENRKHPVLLDAERQLNEYFA